MSRRHFLEKFVQGAALLVGGFLAALVGGAVATPWLRPRSREWVRAGTLADFDVSFRGLTLGFPTHSSWTPGRSKRIVYVRRVGDGALALSGRCTHLGCGVAWKASSARFECPCHGGVYDAEGRVLAGPPPAPLRRYETKIDDGSLYLREA